MNRVILILLGVLLQACNGHYIKDQNIHNKADNDIYELEIPYTFQVEKASGGSFTRNPHVGRFLPGNYSLELSFHTQVQNRVYKSKSNIKTIVVAEAGRTGRVDFILNESSHTQTKPNILTKIIDTTVWSRLKKYIHFELSNEIYNDVMINYYNYSNPIDNISFNRAMYHITRHDENETQKTKALNYLHKNIQNGAIILHNYNTATYTVGVYLIILGDLSTKNKEQYITTGYKLYLKSLNNNYDPARENHSSILKIMGSLDYTTDKLK